MAQGVPSCARALPLSIVVCEVSPQLVVVPAEFTVRVSVADCDCAGLLESVTMKVSDVAVAVAVGVPLRMPVEEASVIPAGSVPLVKDQV